MKLDRFILALRASGLKPDAETVADFFFLAAHMPRTEAPPEPSAEAGDRQGDALAAGVSGADGTRKAPHSFEAPADSRQKSGLFAQGAGAAGTVAATEIEIPEAPALPQTLEIARSLRPLLKPFRIAGDGALDEEATAEQSAHLRQLILVFRPRLERWFDVAMLVEDTPSMAIWSRTIDAFERLLAGLGAFRDIRRWQLNADATVKDATGRSASPTAILAPNARRIVLILTQGVSTAWQSNRFGAAILEWSRRQPTAIVQLLPERLWENTSLGEPRILARSSLPGLPNSQWDLEIPAWMKRRMPSGVALPVLSLDASSLGSWSHMLMARVNSAVPSVFWSALSNAPSPVLESEPSEVRPEDRVDRFRRIASVDGFRLATALSAGPVTLPVLRLINQTLFGESAKLDTIAQVLLGGLLHKEEDHADPEMMYFDFHPGVREQLAGLSHSEDRFAVRRQVTRYLQQHPDTTERFRVLVPHKDGKRRLPKWAEPFADESEPLLRALGLLEEDLDSDASQAATGGTVRVLRRNAIVVGIDEYADAELASLHHCAGEALALGTVLRERGFEVLVFTNQEATRLNVLDAIVEVCERSSRGDLFWFHYSGHAARHGNRKIRLLPHDAKVSSVSRLLELQEIIEPAQRMGLHAIITSDAIYQYAIDAPEVAYIVGGFAHGQSAGKTAPESLASAMVSVARIADPGPLTALSFIKEVMVEGQRYSDATGTSAPAFSIPEGLKDVVLFEAIQTIEASESSSQTTGDLASSGAEPESPTPKAYTEGMPSPSALIGRTREIEMLDQAWDDPNTHLVQIVGHAGVGKTSLMANWARHLVGVSTFWWSFRNHESLSSFLMTLSAFLELEIASFEIEDASSAIRAIGVTKQIVRKLREQRVLILLDGMERLQDETGAIAGTIFRTFIHELIEGNKGLAVCTARLPIAVATQPHTWTIGLSNIESYEMLPHARPGAVAGLLELLVDQQGRGDIYRLADDLAFEIDDLLPIVEAAKLLGFLTVEQGDAVMTSAGFEYARYSRSRSQPLREKELFRNAALENVLLLRQIVSALEIKDDHTVPEDFLFDKLKEQFGEEEALHQMHTAIKWGQYCGLFEYLSAEGLLTLPQTESAVIAEAAEESSEEFERLPDEERGDIYFTNPVHERRFRKDMHTARRIQRSLLDVDIPALNFAEVTVRYATCEEVGGDVYDVLAADDSVSLFLADVSGKGMQAALMAQTLLDVVRGQLLAKKPLEELAAKLSEEIIAASSEKYNSRYATLVILRLDISGSFDYINCGHIHPFILSSGAIRTLEASNVPVGLISSYEFHSGSGQLMHGDRLLIVTDGVVEAMDSHGEMFNNDRLNQVFLQSKNLDDIFTAVSRFRGDAPLIDDCTMLQITFF